ncbi:PREDICTED: nuclear RNA export factor 1 [Nicrophorus vespilloides]|uniref:Nuclear RNA export factor 1 n=1 Tax=Nicrophorus vespilloides TaxID=110193 RepID=A0ABM1NFI2_NICVS|nr:PREDICTED: nuclear RNA export factor 1 [Nicrophorus vespilloides]
MPKPNGKKGGGGGWRNQYNEPDFRSSESTRRVSFKSSRGGNPTQRDNSKKDWANSLKSHFEDEDIDMGSSLNGARYNNKKFSKGGKRMTRGGSPAPARGRVKRKLMHGPITWYSVYMPHGNRYERHVIEQMLMQHIAPLPLIPINWTASGTMVTFYVDDPKVADKLNDLNQEIQMADGFKLMMRVMNRMPNVEISLKLKDRMKLAMMKRYNPTTKALDLTRFHIDPVLQELFCALAKHQICRQALEIISENIRDLEALNLSNNNIHMLIPLKDMTTLLPNLKVLHIGHNKLRDIAQLDSLKGLGVVDLLLDGNPLCDKFKDQTAYISEVRKRLPKVVKLDGIDLPPPISFDIEDDVARLPPSKQTFLCCAEGQAIMRKFMEQYFIIFDSDSRKPLLQAYHENALLSMTMAYPYGQNSRNPPFLTWYATDNRNLQRVTDSERRAKMLKHGNLQIVTFLDEMPHTKHDMNSFTVDLSLFTPQLLLVTVTGIFKEPAKQRPPLRYFVRTFVIVPSGSGYCIVNEEVHISNATEAQIKEAFKTPTVEIVPPTPATSPNLNTSGGGGGPSSSAVPVPDDAVKQQMIQAMQRDSGMNPEWSRKCLEDTNWDYQMAGAVFTEAKNKGLIPQEAFV